MIDKTAPDIDCIVLTRDSVTDEFCDEWHLPKDLMGVYYVPEGTDLYTYLSLRLTCPTYGHIPGFAGPYMLKYPYDPEEVQRVHQARDARMAPSEKRQELPYTGSVGTTHKISKS